MTRKWFVFWKTDDPDDDGTYQVQLPFNDRVRAEQFAERLNATFKAAGDVHWVEKREEDGDG